MSIIFACKLLIYANIKDYMLADRIIYIKTI